MPNSAQNKAIHASDDKNDRKSSTSKTTAHKAMKFLYKEGAKNKGTEQARKLAGLAFNRPKRGTSNGFMKGKLYTPPKEKWPQPARAGEDYKEE